MIRDALHKQLTAHKHEEIASERWPNENEASFSAKSEWEFILKRQFTQKHHHAFFSWKQKDQSESF